MASVSIAHDPAAGITIGVDTHGEVHVAAAFTSDLGRPLGHLEIPTTPAGHGRLLRWARPSVMRRRGSASRVPASTAPGWHATCAVPAAP
jgi:hypothetical protein